MVTVARERMARLFAQADLAHGIGAVDLADRYVRLARRVGTRYNVRMPAEFRSKICRSCLAYQHEGTTVRTRLRSGMRVRTCLRCGRSYRFVYRQAGAGATKGAGLPLGGSGAPIGIPVDELGEEESQASDELDEA